MSKLRLPQWLNPRPFGPKEHGIVTITGASAAFVQSLGLSGGLAPLTLYYGLEVSFPQVCVCWLLYSAVRQVCVCWLLYFAVHHT